MKLKLHSQSQSRGWILHWSASNYGKSCGLLLFSLFFCTFLSAPSWSLRAGCVLNISQWWLILWAAAWSCVKSFWFHRQILQFLSATPESFSQPFFISLYLCLLDSLYLFFFVVSLSLCPGLLSLFRFICNMQLVDFSVRVLRCVSSALLCAGHQNCLSGAQHSRSGGWDPNAEGKRLTEHRGQRRGDKTDGGLQEPLKVYEDQGRYHLHYCMRLNPMKMWLKNKHDCVIWSTDRPVRRGEY